MHNNVGTTGTQRRFSHKTNEPRPVDIVRTTELSPEQLPVSSAAQARLFSEAFCELLLDSSQFVQCVYNSTWLRIATRGLESYLCQYVDDTVILDADDNILTDLQHHALAVTVLPHHM